MTIEVSEGKPFDSIIADVIARGVRVFKQTLDPVVFDYFLRYDYESWRPPLVRRQWIATHVGVGEFLDIGCGAYPVTADVPGGQQRGVGIDVTPQAALRYRDHFAEFYLMGIDRVQPTEIPELLNRFETVVLSETLEHFHKPSLVLEQIKRFMKSEGTLLITYPNAFSIAQRFDYISHGGRWQRFRDFHRSHVFLTSKTRLEALFRTVGFSVIEFDFRPSSLIGLFPPETSRLWKSITRHWPSLFGHQFFYVLRLTNKKTT